jgi:membrane-bound lytic murein transglycosylase F
MTKAAGKIAVNMFPDRMCAAAVDIAARKLETFCMRGIYVLLIGLLVAACTRPPDPPGPGSELVVLTRVSSVTYYEGPDGEPAGFEQELVSEFARRHGYRVRWVFADNVNDLVTRLQHGEAHFAAAALAVTRERQSQFLFGPSYASVRALVLRNVDGPDLSDGASLVGKTVEVVAGSSHVEELKALSKRIVGLKWRAVPAADAETLLEHLESGLVDAVVVDSNDFDIGQNFHPSLRMAFPLGEPRGLAWAFPHGTKAQFVSDVAAFFDDAYKSGLIKRLNERYFGHVDRLSDADVIGILEKRTTVLDRYRSLFQRAQEETGLDWRLIAALGYQESHWNPGAVSPTGVRGLMMMTEDTADHMHVKNRLDPEESTLAAARYLNDLRDSIPPDVREPDRTWLALAAYNVGMAHVLDAMKLARRVGKDPTHWADMKSVLPLLSRPRQFRTLPHGFARGGEAMVMVDNIRTYYDILARFESPHRTAFSDEESALANGGP